MSSAPRGPVPGAGDGSGAALSDHPPEPQKQAQDQDRPDLRLLLPALAGWLGAWAATGMPSSLSLLAAAVAAVAAVVGAAATRRGSPTTRWVAVGVGLCLAGGLCAGGLRVSSVEHGLVRDLAAHGVNSRLVVVVTSDPRLARRTDRPPGRDLVVLRARCVEVSDNGHRVAVRQPVLVLASGAGWLDLVPSQRLVVSGRLSLPRGRDLIAAVVLARGAPQQVSRPSWVQQAAGRLRAGLRAAAAPMPAAERGLLPGLVVGDVSRLPPEVSDDFQAVGMTHLTAVSGSNVAVVLSLLLLTVRLLRLGPRLQVLAALLGLVGFVILARPDPSVLRAAVMGSLAMLALLTGRRRAALPALAATVLVLVLAAPELARSLGFALSVLATGGLLVLAPGLRDRLARVLPPPIAEALAVATAAQVACAPLIAAVSANVSLAAVPANLLAAPAVPPATVLGVLAACLAPVSLDLARLATAIATWPTGWLVLVARVGARAPLAALPWPGGARGAVLLVLATLLAVVLVRSSWAWPAVLAALVAAALALTGVRVLTPGWPPRGWLLVACDVGQGDALVLAAGAGRAVVVDSGPDPELVAGCLDDLRVREVPLLLLTHDHADHVEGLPGVLRGRRVSAIEVSPLDEPAGEIARVRRWAAAAAVPVTRSPLGSERRLGPLRWETLGPARSFAGEEGSAANNASVVWRVQVDDVTLLLTGDIEPPAQQDLLDRRVDLRADVLKIPHHGSDHQQPAFLRATQARLALVSVGVGNSYGHPSARILDQLEGAGVRTLRTDRDGAMAVVGPRRALRAVARGPRHVPSPAGSPATGTESLRAPSTDAASVGPVRAWAPPSEAALAVTLGVAAAGRPAPGGPGGLSPAEHRRSRAPPRSRDANVGELRATMAGCPPTSSCPSPWCAATRSSCGSARARRSSPLPGGKPTRWRSANCRRSRWSRVTCSTC